MRRLLVTLTAFVLLSTPAHASWSWPVRGDVITPYRNGDDPYAAGQHRGIDIAAPVATPVTAAASGDVLFAGTAGSSGLTVSVRTGDGFDTSYLHLSAIAVHAGAHVSAGERLGAVGTSGTRSAVQPHLHFGVREAGKRHAYIDPLSMLPPVVAPPPSEAPRPAPAPAPLPPQVPAPEPAPAPRGAPRPAPAPRPHARAVATTRTGAPRRATASAGAADRARAPRRAGQRLRRGSRPRPAARRSPRPFRAAPGGPHSPFAAPGGPHRSAPRSALSTLAARRSALGVRCRSTSFTPRARASRYRIPLIRPGHRLGARVCRASSSPQPSSP